MRKSIKLLPFLCLMVVNCFFVFNTRNGMIVETTLDTVESMATPEWSPEYIYQAFGVCGAMNLGYKCVKCLTGEYCSHYSCLGDCN